MKLSSKKFIRDLKKGELPAWMKNKYFLTATALLTWMLFFDHNDLISQIRLRIKLADYRSKMDYYQKEIISADREKRELLTDKALLEKFAREKYMMKRPDEDLFIMVPPKKKEKKK